HGDGAEQGLPFCPATDGENVSGRFTGAVQLSSGKFALVEEFHGSPLSLGGRSSTTNSAGGHGRCAGRISVVAVGAEMRARDASVALDASKLGEIVHAHFSLARGNNLRPGFAHLFKPSLEKHPFRCGIFLNRSSTEPFQAEPASHFHGKRERPARYLPAAMLGRDPIANLRVLRLDVKDH